MSMYILYVIYNCICKLLKSLNNHIKYKLVFILWEICNYTKYLDSLLFITYCVLIANKCSIKL